jgi:hypothetical protein
MRVSLYLEKPNSPDESLKKPLKLVFSGKLRVLGVRENDSTVNGMLPTKNFMCHSAHRESSFEVDNPDSAHITLDFQIFDGFDGQKKDPFVSFIVKEDSPDQQLVHVRLQLRRFRTDGAEYAFEFYDKEVALHDGAVIELSEKNADQHFFKQTLRKEQ